MRVSIPSSRYFFEKSPGVFISRANLIAQTPEEELEADKILQLASGDNREYGVYYDPSSEANLSRGKIAGWQWVLVHLSCCFSTLLAGLFLGGIMAAIVAVLAALSYPSVTVQPEDKMLRAMADVDWVGAFLHSLLFVSFDAAFLLSGSRWAWDSVQAISLWAAIAVLFVLCFLQHGYGFWTPGDRILPLGVLRNRIGLGSLFVVAATAGSLSVMLYGIALFCAFARGEQAKQIAAHLLPALGCFGVASLLAKPILHAVRRPAVLYLCGGICVSAGSGALMWVTVHTSPIIIIGLSCLLGTSLGLMSTLSMPVLEANLPPHLRNGVSICLVVVTQTFTTLPIALSGCIYLSRGYHNLLQAAGDVQIPNAEAQQALAGLRSHWLDITMSEIPTSVLEAASASIMDVFAIGIAAGVAMIAAGFIDGFRPWPLHISAQEN
ncbi:MFS transporter [Apiospora hydei]|uniref:MFS transporter n=1 Tax=Apiospora hydei TaxID=1337664 RepID=A0ABR1VIQ2_9PEZI